MQRLVSLSALALVSLFTISIPATSYSCYHIEWTGEIWPLPDDPGVGGLALETEGGQEYMWCSAWYSGQIRRFRLSDGVIDRQFTAPTTESSGLELVEGFLWYVTGFGNVYKLHPVTGENLYECALSSSPRELAWDGGHFWTVDFDEDIWYRFDCPRDSGPIYPTPWHHSSAIAWDGTHPWLGSVEHNYIYKCDPDTGAVLDSAFVWPSWAVRSMKIVPSLTGPWTIYVVPHIDPTAVYKGLLMYDGPSDLHATTWGCVKSLYR